jgi:hypothetical protein
MSSTDKLTQRIIKCQPSSLIALLANVKSVYKRFFRLKIPALMPTVFSTVMPKTMSCLYPRMGSSRFINEGFHGSRLQIQYEQGKRGKLDMGMIYK